MKRLTALTILTALSLAFCGLAIAQEQKSSSSSQNVAQHEGDSHHGDPAALAKHLSEAFPQVAVFDVNKNAKLDDAEKEALRKAVADGKLEFPAHNAPDGAKLSAEMLNHIGEMYARVCLYDTNHDGKLDSNEETALKTAIEKGEFSLHGQHSHEGEHQH